MKYTFWAYGLIALGIAILVGLRFVNDMTTTSEADYYITKEVMQASMMDSIDYGVYRRYGDVRIIKDKFVENFIRRFSESVGGSKTYSIEFYEIYEEPVKATVIVKTGTGSFQVTTENILDTGILTTLSGIVETKYQQDCVQKGLCSDYDDGVIGTGGVSNGSSGGSHGGSSGGSTGSGSSSSGGSSGGSHGGSSGGSTGGGSSSSGGSTSSNSYRVNVKVLPQGAGVASVDTYSKPYFGVVADISISVNSGYMADNATAFCNGRNMWSGLRSQNSNRKLTFAVSNIKENQECVVTLKPILTDVSCDKYSSSYICGSGLNQSYTPGSRVTINITPKEFGNDGGTCVCESKGSSGTSGWLASKKVYSSSNVSLTFTMPNNRVVCDCGPDWR